MAGRITIAEVEELVEPVRLGPNDIHLPGVYVQRVVPLTAEQAADKRIERRTLRPRPDAAPASPAPDQAGTGVSGAAGSTRGAS
jgi:3-oxoacid CoA-transferase subunit A